jgi:hypothetical protein
MSRQLFRVEVVVALVCAGAVGCSGGYGPNTPSSLPEVPTLSTEPLVLPSGADIAPVPPAPAPAVAAEAVPIGP